MWRGEVCRATNLGVKESAGRRVVWRGEVNWVEELCGERGLQGRRVVWRGEVYWATNLQCRIEGGWRDRVVIFEIFVQGADIWH